MFMTSDIGTGIPEVLVRISMPDPKVKVMKLKKLVRRKKKRRKPESMKKKSEAREESTGKKDDKTRIIFLFGLLTGVSVKHLCLKI